MPSESQIIKGIIFHPIRTFTDIGTNERFSKIGIGLVIFSIIYGAIQSIDLRILEISHLVIISIAFEVVVIIAVFYIAKKLDGKGKFKVYLSAFGYASIPQIIGFFVVPIISIVSGLINFERLMKPENITIFNFIHPSSSYFGPPLYFELFSYVFLIWALILGIIAIKHVHKISYFKAVVAIIIGAVIIGIMGGIIFGAMFAISMINLSEENEIDVIGSRVNSLLSDEEVNYAINNPIADKNALKELSDPTSVAVGELNEDGMLDLVVSNRNGLNVSVLLSMGEGTFQSANDYRLGYHGSSLAIDDLNDDNHNDIVIGLNSDKGGIAVLLNSGEGKFSQPQIYNNDSFTTAVSIKDMNKDGSLDIITSNKQTNDISIFFNNGTGNFDVPQNYPANKWPQFVTVDDFDMDGNPDVVVPNKDPEVTLLLGSNDGTFHTKQKLILAKAPDGITMKEINQKKNSFADGGPYHYSFERFVIRPESTTSGDLNGDGIPEIIISNGYSDNISIIYNYGNESFQVSSPIRVGIEPNHIITNDVNRDGLLDLITANGISDNISILYNKGNGTFQTPINYYVGDRPVWIAAGDINGDGRTDFVTANEISNDIGLLLGTDDGEFELKN